MFFLRRRSLQTTSYKLQTSKGFTLVEILVVMAVIAILATFVARSFTGSKQKAQDARRLTDIKNIATALERYYNQNDGYPAAITAGQALKNPGGTVTYLSLVPGDPTNGAAYYYTATGTTYSLAYYLAVGSGSGSGQAAGLYAATPGQVALYQGACPAGGCVMPAAPCVPNCTGKACGSDGCSGSCGTCSGTSDTCTAGVCKCGGASACSAWQTCTTGSCAQDSYTKLLLHFENNLTDSSVNNKTVTDYNTVDNATTYEFGAHSRYFNGTSAYLTVPDSADWNMTSDFTIDTWIYLPAINASGYAFIASHNHSNSTNRLLFTIYSSTGTSYNNLIFYLQTSGSYVVSLDTGIITNLVTLNTWHHIAVVRNGNVWNLYLDGVSKATQTTNPTITDLNGVFVIGEDMENGIPQGRNLGGYMDEFRFSKGIARWTATFTPPTAAY